MRKPRDVRASDRADKTQETQISETHIQSSSNAVAASAAAAVSATAATTNAAINATATTNATINSAAAHGDSTAIGNDEQEVESDEGKGVEREDNKYDKNAARDLCFEADALAKAGQCQAALAKYTASLALDPTSTTVYSNRAVCYMKLNLPEQCVTDLAAAIEVCENAPAAHSLAILLKLLLRHAGAQEMLGHFGSALEDYLEVKDKAMEASVDDDESIASVDSLLPQGLTLSIVNAKIDALEKRISSARSSDEQGKLYSGL